MTWDCSRRRLDSTRHSAPRLVGAGPGCGAHQCRGGSGASPDRIPEFGYMSWVWVQEFGYMSLDIYLNRVYAVRDIASEIIVGQFLKGY